MKKSKFIPLSKGYRASVSGVDYKRVSRHKWSALVVKGNVYGMRRTRKDEGETKYILLHRFILGVTSKEGRVDHIDHNGLNCVRSNLRKATVSQNGANKLKTRGTSKYKGVNWHKRARKWEVQIRVNQKKSYLGLYTNEVEAAKVYDSAAKRLFGRYALLNFPKDTQ